ncbi:endonuclease/exonuclease/phosphatase family protein [Nonomuraea sp. NPDC050404]|uniref:endonuclease/exonuclease/phosphatase family protein n=1 Tax=Nonomuraea sp. NPDC050404 TaxID=3155783 RepID=UPI0033E1FE7A
MRRYASTKALAALTALVLTFLLTPITQAARAADATTAKSAGRKYALVSQGTGKYVTAQLGLTGNQYGRLRATADRVGSWETFTLHTDTRGASTALRLEANGRYVSAEFADGGTRKGMLRARQDGSIGSWERFTLVPAGQGTYALKYTHEGATRYVSAEVNATGEDQGLLRARATGIGAWERFSLRELPNAATTTPAAAQARDLKVMSWNVCANNGDCPMYATTESEFAATVTAAADAAGRPQVIFLQEFCEKLAKPLELALEARPGSGGWDVRFAPIQHEVTGTGLPARKTCAKNRGAYGVALAVPDENTWYEAVELPSPPGKEQRTALCATVESWAVIACTAHFSTGGTGYDDPGRTYQVRQVAALTDALAARPGFRPIFGGDLNATPAVTPQTGGAPVLNGFYERHTECDQGTDRPTKDDLKLDYLFAPRNASWTSCAIATSTGPSDHHAIWGTVHLPAS